MEVVTATVDGDVLAVLANATASFTGRQVHQLAGRHSERGVRNALHRLVAQGIVTRERVGAADQFTFNRAHLAAVHIEGLAGLRRSFLDRVSASIGQWALQPLYAALFGSAATGRMRADSDIDVLIIRPDAIDPDSSLWRDQVDGLAGDVTAWTGNDARILELSAAEVTTGLAGSEPVLVDVRDHGITVHGPSTYLQTAGRPARRARRHG